MTNADLKLQTRKRSSRPRQQHFVSGIIPPYYMSTCQLHTRRDRQILLEDLPIILHKNARLIPPSASKGGQPASHFSMAIVIIIGMAELLMRGSQM